MLRRQLGIGRVHVDVVGWEDALSAIARLVEGGQGGYVFTPNVDHVVLAEEMDELAAAYAGASLSLADGMPILWASRLLGLPLPAKISGSDLVEPLTARAAREGWSVYLLGGRPGAAMRAAESLTRAHPRLRIAGVDAPMMSLAPGHGATERALERVRRARPDLLLLGLGAPKQELLLHRFAGRLGPTVGFGVGAAIDFLAGVVPRAPRWMSEVGLEWFYRLCREPGRMWRRYLVRDPRFLSIVWRTLREPKGRRVRVVPLLPPARAGAG